MVAVKTGPADQLDDVDISIEAQPSRVSIETVCPRKRNSKVSVNFDLKVPRNVNLDSISSVSGSIEMRDIEGRVVGRSVSGNITAQRIGKEANVSSVSGDVRITEARGYIKAESVSGGLSIGDSTPPNLKASAVSGDIPFDGRLNAGGRYELKSHSGTVTLSLPADSGFDLQSSTFSGSVNSDFEIKIRKFEGRKSLNGTAGSGGPVVETSSFSGDILIRQKGTR